MHAHAHAHAHAPHVLGERPHPHQRPTRTWRCTHTEGEGEGGREGGRQTDRHTLDTEREHISSSLHACVDIALFWVSCPCLLCLVAQSLPHSPHSQEHVRFAVDFIDFFTRLSKLGAKFEADAYLFPISVELPKL
jgi:hypothetical protein